MTDDTDITLEQRKSFKRDANNFHRQHKSHYFLLFHFPYEIFHTAGFRNWKALADLYMNLLGLAWKYGSLTKQGLPKITIPLKPLRESVDVPARTFQNQLKKLEALEWIKRKRILGDRINGNRTRIIVWIPKYTLEFLRENDRNGAEIEIGYPNFGVPDSSSTGTPGHTTTTRRRSRDINRKSTKQPGVPARKKLLKEKEAAQRKSDGSNRKQQTTKRPQKHTQAGLIAWYRQQIRKRYGHTPSVNPLALRTKKWGPKRWKTVYAVLGTIIKDWDDFVGAQSKVMKSPPAYPPLEWINSWWNAFSGWHKAHQDTSFRGGKKTPTSGVIKLS